MKRAHTAPGSGVTAWTTPRNPVTALGLHPPLKFSAGKIIPVNGSVFKILSLQYSPIPPNRVGKTET